MKAEQSPKSGNLDLFDPLESLGAVSANLEGDIFQAKFTGSGWIRTGQDEGTFLADVSQNDIDEVWRKGQLPDSEYDAANSNSEISHVLDEKILDFSDLFPIEWQGGVNRTLDTEIEYEIIVKARKIHSNKIRIPKEGGNA